VHTSVFCSHNSATLMIHHHKLVFVCASDWCNTHSDLVWKTCIQETPYNGSEEAINHVWRLLQLHDDISACFWFVLKFFDQMSYFHISLSLSPARDDWANPLSVFLCRTCEVFLTLVHVVLSSSTHLSRPACQLC